MMYYYAIAAVLIIEILVLHLINIPKYRYYQIWTPVFALIINIAVMAFGFQMDTNWSFQLLVEEQVIQRVQELETVRPLDRFYIYNLTLGAAFLGVKFLVNISLFLLASVLGLFGLRIEKILDNKSVEKGRPDGIQFLPGYIYVAREKSITVSGPARLLGRAFHVVAFILAAFTLAAILLNAHTSLTFYQPFYTVPILLLFFELAFYLGHRTAAEEATDEDSRAEKDEKIDIDKYRNDLKNLWSKEGEEQHLLRHYQIEERLFTSSVGEYLIEEESDDGEGAAGSQLKEHLYKKYPVVQSDREEKKIIDDYIEERGDTKLIRYGDYEQLNRLFYTVALQAIINDTHIVLLTGERDTQQVLKSRIEHILDFIDIPEISEKSIIQVGCFDDFRNKELDLDIMICSQDQLIAYRMIYHREDWFARVGDVIAYDVRSTVFANPILFQTVLLDIDLRRKSEEKVRTTIISDDRGEHIIPAIEASIDRNIGVDGDCRYVPSAPPAVDVFLWKSEGGQWFQQALYKRGSPSDYLGIEQSLLVVGAKWGVEHQLLAQQMNQPWRKNAALYENKLSDLDPEFLDEKKGSRKRIYELGLESSPWYNPAREPWSIPLPYGGDESPLVIILRDEQYNWPNLVRNFAISSGKKTLIHTVSPPYLLRNFMVAHAGYFLRSPVRPFALMNKDPWISRFYRLVYTLVRQEMSEEELSEELVELQANEDLGPGVELERKLLTLLVEILFGDSKSKSSSSSLSRVTRYIDATTRRKYYPKASKTESGFRKIRYYRLKEEILDEDRIEWMRNFEIRHQNNILSTVTYDHLYQRYFRGRLFAQGGELYRVTRIIHTKDNRIVQTEIEDSPGEFFYKQDITFKLINTEKPTEVERKSVGSVSEDRFYERYVATAHYSVQSNGAFIFKNDFSIRSKGADTYERLDFSADNIPPRRYTHGRMLVLRIQVEKNTSEVEPTIVEEKPETTAEKKSEAAETHEEEAAQKETTHEEVPVEEDAVQAETPDEKNPQSASPEEEAPAKAQKHRKGAFTLAVLLQELFPTLFPEVHELVHAVAPYSQKNVQGSVFKALYPDCPSCAKETESGGDVVVFVFEDSHLDLGAVYSLNKNWDEVLELMQDYLRWSLDEDRSDLERPVIEGSEDTQTSQIYVEAEKRDFLKYCRDAYPEELDLRGALDILDMINPAEENRRTNDRANYRKNLVG